MNIELWFDPMNIEHLKAYRHLGQFGFWPIGFIPDDVTFAHNWHIKLLSVLSEAYLKDRLG